MSNLQEHILSNLFMAILYSSVMLCVFIAMKKNKVLFRKPNAFLLLLCLVQCVGRGILTVCYYGMLRGITDLYIVVHIASGVLKLLTFLLIAMLLLTYLSLGSNKGE